MIRMCPPLAKRVKIQDSQKRIIYTPTSSFHEVLSAEAYSKHGFNISGEVFDELHTQPNRALVDVMTKGSGDARTQPLHFFITTAGTDTHSICYEYHQKALDLIDGKKHDPTFYPVVYGAAPEDDWTAEATWFKANPSLGITVPVEKVQQACHSARQNPAEENTFRQLRLNQWVKQFVRWMPMHIWEANNGPVDLSELEGRTCYGGLDLASTTDITAFVLVFPPEDAEDQYVIALWFWIPEDNLKLRVARDHVPYDAWAAQGHLQDRSTTNAGYWFCRRLLPLAFHVVDEFLVEGNSESIS
ncbi:terminase TerL endonuclease subunit [Corynebacterium sp. 76QC2CO]|uniref:terminase TerL endonuclease subunit n=1 Tax=Corynebacterium kozikiae TaxID=2968469 RepID=UPI00211C649A|nr:terminase TerL endonuclease subunit [Corynebacterium sp. 76QC2CO]MCQ9343997.1 terminase large subunit [Corynebacterium sp. 76QC2CO]